MGRAGLAVGGVALIAVGAAIGFGGVWPSEAEAEATVTQPIEDVRVDSESGDVTVRVGDVEHTTVRQVYSYRWGDPPETSYSVDDGVLVLGECDWFCSVSFEVTVPRGTTVSGHLSSGDATLEGVAAVDMDIDSGDVRLMDVAGPVRVGASSGDVVGERLSGEIDIEANSGGIELALAEPGDVRAHANSGDIDLTVPRGSYRVEGESNSGERDIQVIQDPSASHQLQLDANSGDVTVEAT